MSHFDLLRIAALGSIVTVAATSLSATVAQADGAAAGSAVSATPRPSSTPTPDIVSDPCGGPARLLATLNRPTIGYSACALPKGAIVLENGYQIQTQGGPSAAVVATYPQGFQRVGVADRVEIDLIGPAYNRSRIGNAIAAGYSDLGLGFKYELPQRGRFTYAVDGLFEASTGTGGFGAGGPTSAVNLDIAYAASPAIGIGTTLAGYTTDGMTAIGTTPSGLPSGGVTSRFGYFLPSLVVTAQIPNYYQFYAELVGRTKLAPDQGGQIFTDFGVQKLLGPYLEADAEYGFSFTPVGGSRFHYVGAGLGIRVK